MPEPARGGQSGRRAYFDVGVAQPQSPQLQHWQSTQVQGAQAQQPQAAGAVGRVWVVVFMAVTSSWKGAANCRRVSLRLDPRARSTPPFGRA